jgi:hypothetical protein
MLAHSLCHLGKKSMSQFRSIFSHRHVILPVMHVESHDQAHRNADIARSQGCDGIFLINHGIPYTELLEIHHRVVEDFPHWWIGVNCLDLTPCEVFLKISDEVDGIWVDNAMIDERTDGCRASKRTHQELVFGKLFVWS